MKTKIFRISKRSISLLLSIIMIFSMMLVGMVTTSASSTHTGGHIYFNNPNPASWSYNYVYLAIGKNDYTSLYEMTPLEGTDVYYVDLDSEATDWDNKKWSDATYCAVMARNTAWDSGYFGYSHITGNADNWYTDDYTEAWSFSKDTWYRIEPDNSNKGAAMSISYLSNKNLDLNMHTQTLKTMIDDVESDQDVAKLTIESYYIDDTTHKSKKSTSDDTNGTAFFEATIGADTKLSYSEVDPGYTFVGWKKGTTSLGDSAIYEYEANSDATYYACFESDVSEIITNDDKSYVYYEDNKNWSKVNAYAWNSSSDANGTWPGNAMTNLSGDIYYINLGKEYNNVIFNQGTDNYQTSDLTVEINKMYDRKNEEWVDPPYYTVTATAKYDDTSLDVKNLVHTSYTTARVACFHTLDLTAPATVTVDETEYVFTGWSVPSDSGTLSGNDFTPTKDCAIVAQYELGDTSFAITANADENVQSITYEIKGTDGNYTEITDLENVEKDSEVRITVTPKTGYYVSSATSTQVNTTCQDNVITFTMPGKNVNLTIATSAYNASYEIKYKSLDPNTNQLSTLKSDTTGVSGTVTITDIPASTTYLATPNDNYTFVGWYEDADCTKTYASLPSVLTEDIKLYAYFEQTTLPKHTLTINNAENVTVTAKAENNTISIAEGEEKEVNEGATVTLTLADIPANHSVTSVKVNGDNATEVSENTYTFKMPAEAATVVVTVAEVQKYSVTTYVNASNLGSASTSASTVVAGETVTLTATPSGNNTFKSWTITGNYDIVEGTLNNTELKITVNGNITATANFQEYQGKAVTNRYFFHNTSDSGFSDSGTNYETGVTVYELSDGVYSAPFTPTEIGETSFSETNYVAISTSNNVNDIYSRVYGNFRVVTETSKYVTLNGNKGENRPGVQENKSFHFVAFTLSDASNIDRVVVSYNENTSTYTINAYSDIPEGAVKVYAKDGTIREKYNKYSKLADTEFTDTTGFYSVKVDANERQEAIALLGTTISIKTTIKDTYRSKYYVKGFNVNGETYGITTKEQANNNTTGIYTMTYTIPEDFEGDSIEITPVYFYKDDTNTITFYVEGFDDAVKEKWGDIISCHAYYDGIDDLQDDSNDEAGKNALGGYPGQPMIYEGGKYYMQIPKSLTVDKSTKKFKGITLNNYVWDDVHKGRAGGEGNNCQTYDYNDLAVIAERGQADNITFAFKYRISNDNNPDSKPDDNNYASVFTNGWENLTDNNQRDVDVFGNLLNNEEINTNKSLRIVSNGYAGGSSYIGSYATEWTVYAYENNDWTKVGKIASSALLYETVGDLETAIGANHAHVTTYKALKEYENYPAEITYEKSITNNSGSIGNRADGRWYYAQVGEKITVNTKIEYATDLNSTFAEDPFNEGTNQGTITSTKAFFTSDDENVNGKTTIEGSVDNEKNFNFKAETDAAGKYYFVGWYLLKDGVYTLLSRDATAYAPMTSSETYVARYIDMPTGMMTLTHSLYKDAPKIDGMDKPNNGTGTCYIQVDILDFTGTNVIKTYNKTTNPITIGSDYLTADSTNKLRVTLTTDINGLSTFNNHYVNTETGYSKWDSTGIQGKTGTVTKSVTFEISRLFKVGADDTPEFYVDALNFYSDINPVTKPFRFTYNYKDRFGDDKYYVVKGTLSESYIDRYYNEETKEIDLDDSFIMSRAPYEDNFGKKITWDENNIVTGKNGEEYTATVDSTQTEHTVVVNYMNKPDAPWENVVLPFGSLVQDKDGNFICVAERELDGQKFSHWEVYTDEACTNFVTKCYWNEFNFIAYDNYYIKPIYADTPESPIEADTYTTLDFLEYSRNQWTDAEGNKTSKTDKLYADFNLAFNYQGQLLNSVNDKVECGMLLEVCGKIGQASDGSYISDVSKYNFTTDYDELKNAVLAGDNSYTADNGDRNLIKSEIENLDNKNRIEFYQGFNNSASNPLYVVKCYSYMIIDGDNGEKVVLSDPVYINLYDVANFSLNQL